MESLNPHVKKMEYAVRGLIPLEAMKIQSQLKQVGYCLCRKDTVFACP